MPMTPPVFATRRISSSVALRGFGRSPPQAEWETITGLVDRAAASRAVASLTWARSTTSPIRFISLTTSMPKWLSPVGFRSWHPSPT